MSTSAPVPPELVGILDDATLLDVPPEDVRATLRERLADHRRRLVPEGPVGSLVVTDELLLDVDREASGEHLTVTVNVSGGAGGFAPAAHWASGCASLNVRCLATTLRDLDDLAGAARRTVTAAQQALDAVPTLGGATVSVEVPLSETGRPGWLTALDEVAAADLTLGLRTGGGTPAPPASVVKAIDAALDRELPMRFTGSAHGHLAASGTPGYSNLLTAVRLTLDGDLEEAAAILSEGDEETLARRRDELGGDALARARRFLPSLEGHG